MGALVGGDCPPGGIDENGMNKIVAGGARC